MTRVLIVGAGIGGCAAALALHKAGFEVTVHEAHPVSGADIGAFLTLASNGMQALGQLDAAELVAEVGFPLSTMRVIAEDGTTLVRAPLGAHENPLTRFRCLRRADLGAALHAEVLRRDIPVSHGARLVSTSEDGSGVTATFADGSTAHGDLLIGADGLNSVLRGQIDPAAPAPRYAGQRVFYGYTSDIEPRGEAGEIGLLTGSGAAFGFAASPAGETYWFARVPGETPLSADEIATTSTSQWRELLVALLRKDNTPAADIVAATERKLLVTNANDLAGVPRWHTERMLIIGDAAHAASPATGQGASMALEDAVILAKALRDAGDIDTALRTYEQLRRPRVEQNTANSARMTVRKMPDADQRAQDNERLRQQREQQQSQQQRQQQGERQQGDQQAADAAADDLLRQLDWETPLTPAS